MKFRWCAAPAALAIFGAMVFLGVITFTLLLGKFIWAIICAVAMCACVFAAAGIIGGMLDDATD